MTRMSPHNLPMDDPDFMEKFEAALKKRRKEMEPLKEAIRKSEIITGQDLSIRMTV